MRYKFLIGISGLICSVLMCADFTINPSIFSPNESPGIKDTLYISGYIEQTLPISVNMYWQNQPGVIQRTIPYSQFDYSYGDIFNRALWDGKNNSGNFVPDGVYEIKFKTTIARSWSKGNTHRDLRGIFISPYDVAIGADGKVYVLDTERIQVFDSSRNYLFSIFNPPYSESGHWDWATSIAIYGNRLYVMDAGYEQQNIKIFDTTGNFIKKFGSAGSGDNQFDFDWENNISADSSGRIWVVDSGNSRVQVFNSDGNLLFKFGSYGTGNGQFDFTYITGNVAIDSSNNAYITDSGGGIGRIQVFNSSGVYQRTINSAYDGGPMQLVGINSAIAICSTQNRICVSSFNNNKIVILNNNGTYLAQIGRVDPNGMTASMGRGQSEFDFLSKIRGTSTGLYSVECYDNKRVQIFNTGGTYSSQIGLPTGDFLNPSGIAIGPNGNIYVCDCENARIQIFNQSGVYQSQILVPYASDFTLLKPAYIAIDTDGKVYVCGNEVYGRLQVLNVSGSLLGDIELKDNEDKNIFVRGLVIVGNYIYISGYSIDGVDKKVFVFNKAGVFQNSFGSFNYDISYDNCGNIAAYSNRIYVIDTTGTKVFQTDGTPVTTFPQINSGTAIAIDNSGRVYTSGTNDEIRIFDANGNSLYHFGEADSDSDLYCNSRGITVDSALNVYFSDDYYHRVYKYSTTADEILDTVSCEVDNTKPSSIITYPPHTPISNMTGNFQITGTAMDTHFELYSVYRDSTIVGTGINPVVSGPLANIDISSLSETTHTIFLMVEDLAGNTGSDSVVFYIDGHPPVSSVTHLNQYTASTSFQVEWTGSDLESGISFYDIQYRDGAQGSWVNWLLATTQESATFSGEDGHTYYFRSRARDNGGNWESYPSGYDTYTMIDISKPVFVKATPVDNSYVGAKPLIKVEISDVIPGSGINSSGITVQVDGNNQGFTFSNNIITINPTFTKGLHILVINFSDRAGNMADTLTLHYDAMNFKGSVAEPVPTPNPAISEVMAGGQVYRWYKVVNQNNIPASGVVLKIEWNNGGLKSATTDSSDLEGLVACVLDADDLGSVNQTITCSIVEVGGNAVNPPITFNVKILPRNSSSEFSFGSGINIKAAMGVGGKIGTKKGMTYRIIDTDLHSESDDKIEVEKSFEGEAGVLAEASVGGGIKNSCYAGAEAGAYASLVMMYTNTFLFDDPYASDQQQILRSGLVIASLLEEMNIPIVSDILGYVISGYNDMYPVYKKGETFSAGLRVGANASADAGFGLGDKNNVFLGIGVGAGISGEAEILGKLLFSFDYENSQLNTSEIGAGVSSSIKMDIFAGAQGNVIGEKIKAGIGANTAGVYDLTVFADTDGTIKRAELKISSETEWGIEHPESGPGTTKSTIIILSGDQIYSIMNDLVDLLGLQSILQGQNPSSTVILGPTEIASRFLTLITDLESYISEYQLPLAYRIEEETGDSFGFSPTIKVALGAEIEVGCSVDFEKVVSSVTEEGIINIGGTSKLRVFPLAHYEKDDYIPSCEDLTFRTIFDDCVSGIITAMTDVGELVVEAAETIGDTIVSGIHWISRTVDDYIPFLKKNYLSSKTKQLSSGLDEVFSFTPEGINISDLSAQIISQVNLSNGSSNLMLNPGEDTGLLTIHYNDTGLTPQNEAKLIIYWWDSINRKWVGLENSQVDINLNNVSVEVEKLGMFRLGIPVPYGEIVLSTNPRDVDLSAPSSIIVVSQPILLVTGENVPDGTLITVSTQDKFTSEVNNFGIINVQDADPSTDGIQIPVNNGVITFTITPPSVAGSGIIIADSVYGNASGKAYFNVINNLDVDGNGLPDYWEKFYFGSTGQSINGNPDTDGLTNLQEYESGTDPLKFDTDNDGMSDGWEENYKLNPLLNDANLDPDNDGYSNLIEYQAGSNPHNKNSIPGNKGDLNNDGITDISDVILCLRQAIFLDPQTPSSADMNDDGSIDISDVILVLRKAIGLDLKN